MSAGLANLKETIDLPVEVIEVTTGFLDARIELTAIVLDELAEIPHIHGDVVHQASAQVDVLLVHEGEDLFGSDIELLADGVQWYLRDEVHDGVTSVRIKSQRKIKVQPGGAE